MFDSIFICLISSDCGPPTLIAFVNILVADRFKLTLKTKIVVYTDEQLIHPIIISMKSCSKHLCFCHKETWNVRENTKVLHVFITEIRIIRSAWCPSVTAFVNQQHKAGMSNDY